MSADVSTPLPNKRPPSKRLFGTNRGQMLLFALLTLTLTVATVVGTRIWLRNSETLTFAVGNANGPEARFAARLAAVLKNNASRFRLKIISNQDMGKALSQFERREADLAILRTDAKIPPRARALAILEHDVLLLITPASRKIKSLADLIGSIFVGIYTSLTRIAPEKASELATAILDVGERIAHANTMDALDSLQDELEGILRGAVIGLRDGTISSDGLDTFKLGYEFVRDEIGMRRESLKRQAGHDDNVVIVKAAQSA